MAFTLHDDQERNALGLYQQHMRDCFLTCVRETVIIQPENGFPNLSNSMAARGGAMDLTIQIRVICGCIVIFLGGCAPVEYKPDLAGKPTARIRVVSIHPVGVFPRQLDGGSCVPAPWVSPLTSGFGNMPFLYGMNLPNHPEYIRREAIGIPMTGIPSAANFTEQTIIAGTPIVLQFSTSYNSGPGKITSCASGIDFTAEKGADYEAIFSAKDQGCAMSLRKLRLDSAGRVVEESVPSAKAAPTCARKNIFGQDLKK